MKTIAIFCILLAALPAWAGTFRDDFDDGNDDGWERWGNFTTNAIGEWEVVDGRYVITTTTSDAHSVWGDLKWADYTVEVRARSTNNIVCSIGILVRVQGPRNFYTWVLDAWTNTLVWWLIRNGSGTRMTQDPAPGNALDEHLYKVVVSGDQFEGYYDGKLIRKWQHNLFKTGRVAIGLACGGKRGQAVFDDFVMTGPGVPDSGFSVSPWDRLTTTWGEIKQSR